MGAAIEAARIGRRRVAIDTLSFRFLHPIDGTEERRLTVNQLLLLGSTCRSRNDTSDDSNEASLL